MYSLLVINHSMSPRMSSDVKVGGGIVWVYPVPRAVRGGRLGADTAGATHGVVQATVAVVEWREIAGIVPVATLGNSTNS